MCAAVVIFPVQAKGNLQIAIETTNGVHCRFPKTLQLVHRLDVGGAEILAARFARRFGGPARVVVGCLDDDGPLGESLRAEGFKVASLGRRPGPIDLHCLHQIRRLVAAEQVELIHAHQATPFFYALAARGLFAHRPRILFTEHGRFFPDRRDWKRAWIQPRLLGRNDRVVAVGESVRRALATNEGLPWSRIDVIYNGIDVKCDATRGAPRDVVRAELGIAPDAFVILQVARLDPIKNHALSLKAMGRLAADRASAILALAGDGPERTRLEELAREHGMEASVRFLGTRNDASRLYAAADAALLTSMSEGIPLTLIEAMAAGLPVVATAVGGVPEVVEQTVTGLLADNGDDAAIAASLRSLMEDVSLRQRMGVAGIERARRLFDEERMFAEYAALLGMDAA